MVRSASSPHSELAMVLHEDTVKSVADRPPTSNSRETQIGDGEGNDWISSALPRPNPAGVTNSV